MFSSPVYSFSRSQVTAGEGLAFVIGWSVILEYVLSAAGVARGWSATLDSMFGGAIRNFTVEHIGELPVGDQHHFVSKYLDVRCNQTTTRQA